MKTFHLFLTLTASLLFGLPLGHAVSDSHQLIFEQHQLEQEGKKLEQIGDFEGAIQKYNLAIEYDKKINGDPRGRPLAFIVRTLQKQEKYEDALEKLKYLKSGHEKHERYIDWEKELKAIIEYQSNAEADIIYEHINYLRQKYKNIMPPVAYDGIFGVIAAESILRLYDTIGDHDAGIQFIDEILFFLKSRKQNRKEDYEIYDRIKTVQQATACAGLDKPTKSRGKEWRACKLILEYLLVREAFEQDKAAGTKGRATKALIQSDYFPW